MERKEHPVPVITGSGDSLEVLDADGNPYIPDGPVKYQILGEDGSTLKEGTLEDTNLIPLEGVTTKSFRVVLENHFVLDVKGFESPEEEASEGPIQSSDEDDEPLPNGDLEEFEEYEGSFEDDAQYAETDEGSEADSDKESDSDEESDQSPDEAEDSEEDSSDSQEGKSEESDSDQLDDDSENESDSDSEAEKNGDDSDEGGKGDDET